MFSLFCDLGGVLGLYIGFSILTIFEFFELFASLAWICVVRLYHGATPVSASVDTVGDSKVVSDGNSAMQMESSLRPPAYDRLTSNDQFQLLTNAKNLPSVNC